ncbi:MAG: YraN family protein [Phycisphaeraceae bacterium]|nr:YraN family protein [Phycisphaeraceae bacterium]
MTRWWRAITRFLGRVDYDSAFVGRRGEAATARYVRRRGLRVLDRNVRLSRGEIDLVCEPDDESMLILVEVKARAVKDGWDAPYLPPEEAVDREKRERLVELALELRRRHRRLNRPVRIDVAGVDLFEPGTWRERVRLRYFEGEVKM